jgi:predicted TIM-barrel fold metal-dependent hydrolase
LSEDTQYTVVSADSHVIEPHDLWQRRVPAAVAEHAPKLQADEDSDRIVMDGKVLTTAGLLAGCARGDEDVRWEGRWDVDVFRGGYDPKVRLDDLARDGVDAEVLFPTIGMLLYPIGDVDLQWTLFKAYNDWLAEEFCAYAPDRFKGIAMINHEDIDKAIAESRRAKEMGHVGVMVPLFAGEDNPYHGRPLDRLWAELCELELPVNLHTATTRDSNTDWTKGTPTDNILNTYQVQHVLMDMILSGLFDRFPELKIVSAENDVGWAGSMLERADYYWTRNRNFKLLEEGEILCKELPSHYFHQNVRVTFMRDHTGVLAREIIGEHTMMWGNDFPHHVSTWPHSKAVLDEHFVGVPDDVRDLITCTNARDLYQF